MTKPLFSILIAFSLILNINAQVVEFKKGNESYSYEILNNVAIAKGMIVLFNYSGGNGLTNIPTVAEKDSILVINIALDDMIMQNNDLQKVDNCIYHASSENNISSNNYIIGGFSGGGVCATRYAELVIERKLEALTPKGLFIGDAPIDYLVFYNQCKNELNRNCGASNIGKQEAEYIIKDEYEKAFGDPVINKAEYVANSPVTITEADLGNGKYLLELPVRCYHEVDPMWYIKERCRNQFTDENIAVGTELIKYLYLNGNNKAELIISQGQGYRKNGFRHPHSWSIIEAKGLLDWYKKLQLD